jgi:hypothetical protein
MFRLLRFWEQSYVQLPSWVHTKEMAVWVYAA